MASIAYQVISCCWLIFLVFWIIAAARLKVVAERQNCAASLAYKVPTLLGAILLWRQSPFPALWIAVTPQNDLMRVAGAILCAAGLGVAIWARQTLAGNWSSNITFKQGHELVKTGPYRFARHPIYTGLLLMALGTAVAAGQLRCWLGIFFFFVGFWIKLKAEEKLMMRHFPDQYPAYRKEVKALVPFIW